MEPARGTGRGPKMVRSPQRGDWGGRGGGRGGAAAVTAGGVGAAGGPVLADRGGVRGGAPGGAAGRARAGRGAGTNLNQAVGKLNATGQAGEDLLPAAQFCARVIRRLDETAEQLRRSAP